MANNKTLSQARHKTERGLKSMAQNQGRERVRGKEGKGGGGGGVEVEGTV